MLGKRLLLFLFILISLSLMTYQSNRTPFLPLKSLNSALNVFYDMKVSVKEFISAPFRRMFLREEENRRLKTELSQLLKEQQVWREAFRENQKLREVLALKEKEQHYVTAARVVARGTDQWSHTLILDKGLTDGIKKDMVAITDKGLVGKISDVSPSYAYLLLLTDINFSAAVRLQENRTEGVLSGTGFRACQLKYIPYEEELKLGAAVVTSGLDSIFPGGIPLGYISKINKKESGLFQYIEVIPYVDNTKIEVVAIIRRA
ncbi:MAG: mreC [Nitrospirae bacterium]|nr:mreC [Nitrospirota bacterium]